MKRKVLKFLVFSWRVKNLQNEIKENVFFWNGKKNLLNCFQTVKTSEKKNQKMNLVKIFSCMKPKENVFNPENIFFFVHSVSFMSLKNNVRNKTKNIYWVFYIQGNLKQSEKNKFKEKPGEKMFLKNFFLIKTERN